MYVVDTNVISEMRRIERANRDVAAWMNSADPDSLYCSSISILELQIGALSMWRKDPVQGEMLLTWIARRVMPQFAERILSVDTLVAMACAPLKIPDPRPDRDAFIAATALVHDMTVVTRNERDFAGTGVRVLNPWPPG